LSIDPLSSQGVETAIGISLHAGVVLNTMMEEPGNGDLAMEFYRSRLGDSATFHAAAAAGFYREQYASCGSEFWRRCAQGAVQESRGSRDIPIPIPAPDTLVRVASSAEFAALATVKGQRVVAEDGIRFQSRTFAYVGDGRLVAALLRDIDGPTAAIEVVRRWSRKMPAEEALKILKWAWAEGLIEGCQ
jgi:hypothetical protein